MTNVFLNIPITRVSRVNFIIEVTVTDEQLDKIDVLTTEHEYLIWDIDTLKTSADKTTIYPVGSDLKISLSNLLGNIDVSN